MGKQFNQESTSAAYFSDIFGSYASEVERYPLLTRDDERRFGKAAHGTGRKAQEAYRRLVEGNLRLVLSIARKYQNKGLPPLDLIQEGNIGLMRAVRKYNPSLGFRFSTYATWWIKQAIRYAIRNQTRMVRVPTNVIDLAAKASRWKESLRDPAGRDPDLHHLSLAMGNDPEAVGWALKTSQAHAVSLEALTSNEEPDGSSELIAAKDTRPALSRSEVAQLLSLLDPRERHIVSRRFGLNGWAPAELHVLAKDLGVSRERIRQLEVQAIEWLRRKSENPGAERAPRRWIRRRRKAKKRTQRRAPHGRKRKAGPTLRLRPLSLRRRDVPLPVQSRSSPPDSGFRLRNGRPHLLVDRDGLLHDRMGARNLPQEV